MQYTVVHSKDPYLLARLATDLQMENKKFTPAFEDPFMPDKEWMCIYKTMTIGFYSHDCRAEIIIRHELTSRNYIKVLTQILEP